MTNRITNADLERLLIAINKATGNALEPYANEPWTDPRTGMKTNNKANVGTYYISGAYGGVKLVQICNEFGGERTVSSHGYGTKRQLYTFMQGMLNGLVLNRE